MAFGTIETSEYLARLIEYYKFSIGGTIYRYTNAPTNQTLATGNAEIDGVYLADGSISISPVEHARDAGSLSARITLRRDHPVALLFLNYVPDTPLTVTVFRKHVSDGQVVAWFPATARACEFKESLAELTVEPLLSKQSRVGLYQRFQLTCNLTVYSARCGESADSYKSSVTVTAINGRTITVSGMPVVANGYYNGGFLKNAAGTRRAIELHVGSSLTLLMPLAGLAVGNVVDIFAGCDGAHTTCRTRFTARDAVNGNIKNFFGVFTAPDRNPFANKEIPVAGASGFASVDRGIIP